MGRVKNNFTTTKKQGGVIAPRYLRADVPIWDTAFILIYRVLSPNKRNSMCRGTEYYGVVRDGVFETTVKRDMLVRELTGGQFEALLQSDTIFALENKTMPDLLEAWCIGETAALPDSWTFKTN